MASIDLKVFNHRHREIRRLVRLGSPAVVYSGTFGIAIAAVLRPGVTWRVGKVMDRMAIIGRGQPVARTFIHKVASAEARSIAGKFSQGDVRGAEPAHAVAAYLQDRNSRYTLGPALPVEACFVQLNASPEDDYLAYIPLEGTIRTFRKVWFLGEAGGRETSTAILREAAADQINDLLGQALGDYETFSELWEALAVVDLPAPVRSLRNNPKLDVVVLDRQALNRQEYDKVFHRLTL